MRGVLRLAFIALFALPSFAQVLTSTSRGVVVAHDGRIEMPGRWSVDGVVHATAIEADDERVVVLDALGNEAVIVTLANGRATRMHTAETPVAAAFVGRELYILARDARVLQHVGGRDLALSADPALLATANGRVYVYSRAAGVLEDDEGRRMRVPPFASDLEISGHTAYLAYPREARIRTIDLNSLKTGEVAVGAVPVDIAFAGGGTAISARILAVADPSAKRVWLTESTQSMAEAVARGFLRGFIGLGLFGSRSSAFPTGADRVETRGPIWIAYDSSSGTLYRFTRRQSTVVAKNVAPHAFALTETGVAWWSGTSVAETRLR